LYILGDTHVYNSHIGALQEQIKRTPNTFPSLEIIRDDFESNSESNSKLKFDWSKWSVDDFQLKNYQPQGELKMQMAV
jgi:thymidylate synthase